MRRKKEKVNRRISESWLLPYADMLTLLVALFIVLFAISDINSQKYEQIANFFRSELAIGGVGILDDNDGPEETPPSSDPDEEEEEKQESEESEEDESSVELKQLQQMESDINGYIDENNLAEKLGTELTDEGLLITMQNEIFFDSGSAEVKADGEEVAKEVAKLLYTDPPHQVVVAGHADDRPISSAEYASNWELSVARAVNFMKILLENEDLDPTLFSAKGYGEYKPIVPNTSEENRAKNRRVEVLITPNYEINVSEED